VNVNAGQSESRHLLGVNSSTSNAAAKFGPMCLQTFIFLRRPRRACRELFCWAAPTASR
jgi:hypothetical protein